MKIKEILRAGAGITIALTMVGPAVAQTAGPSQTDSGEIVVTALKRSESVQRVPATVAVIGAQELQANNITTIAALREVVGGLQLRQSTNGTPELKLRGLGTSTTVMSFEQSVGAFVDGAYLGHGRAFQLGMFDADRIELVKGTQAALLGKNTSLGAISLATRRPGDTFAYNLLGSYEFELESTLLSGGVDIPLSDTFRLRVAGQYDRRGGWVHNIHTNHDGPETEDIGGRVTAVWEPNPQLDATFTYQYMSRDRVGMPVENVVDWGDLLGGAFSPFGAAGYPGDTTFDYRSDYNTWFGEGRERDNGHLGIATLNYHLSDGTTLTSQTSYLHFNMKQRESSTFTYFNAWDSDIKEHESQISQEFRIASPGNQRIDYLAGLYLSRDIWGQDLDYRAYGDTSNGGYSSVNPPPAPSAAVAAVQPLVTAEMIDSSEFTTDTAALFGVVTLNPTDKLSIDLSGRLTNESREIEYVRYFPIGMAVAVGGGAAQSTFANCLAGTGTAIAGNYPTCMNQGGGFQGTGTHRVEATHTDGSISVNYDLTPDVRVYASYGQGTKGAGFSNQDAIAGRPYGVEVAHSSEVGVKTRFADGRGRFNVALFSTEIDNLQTAVFTGGQFITSNRNVRSQGVDIDLDWRPLDNLSIGLMTTYAEVKNLNSPGDATLRANTPVSGAPLWSGVLRAQWTAPIAEGYELSVTPSVNFRSHVNMREYQRGPLNCVSDPTAFVYSCFYPRSDAYEKINLRVALENTLQGWEVAFVGNNLTDERVLGYAYPAGAGTTQATVEQPRTIAVQFSLRR